MEKYTTFNGVKYSFCIAVGTWVLLWLFSYISGDPFQRFPASLSYTFLGIETRYYLAVLAGYSAAMLGIAIKYSTSEFHIARRLDEKGIDKNQTRNVFIQLIFEGLLVFIPITASIVISITGFEALNMTAAVAILSLYAMPLILLIRRMPDIKGENYFVRSAHDPILDEIEEINRLRVLKKEKERKQRLDEYRKEIEKEEYELKTLESDLGVERVGVELQDEKEPVEPQTLESVIDHYNKQIEIIEMAEKRELEGITTTNDIDQKRRESFIRANYQRMRNDASNELQEASRRVYRDGSPFRKKEEHTYEHLVRDFTISLETLEQYRQSELKRISAYENPLERDKAKREFIARHGKMRKDLEEEHEVAVQNLVRKR